MYYFETALNNLESDVKEEPSFHTFLQMFYKNFKILVLIFLILYQFWRRLMKNLPRYKETFISM